MKKVMFVLVRKPTDAKGVLQNTTLVSHLLRRP